MSVSSLPVAERVQEIDEVEMPAIGVVQKLVLDIHVRVAKWRVSLLEEEREKEIKLQEKRERKRKRERERERKKKI